MGDFFKSLFPEDKTKEKFNINRKQRKYIIVFVLLALVGAVSMSLGNKVNDNIGKNNTIQNNLAVNGVEKQFDTQIALLENSMENNLEDILSQIKGVGKAEVNLTVESSIEYQYALNKKKDETIINEKAQDGSTRSTTENSEDAQLVMKSMTQGKDEPVIIKEIRPQVVGVMIVAEGADNMVIKERISEAVQVLLNIPSHRVTVLPKGKLVN